MLLLVMVMCSGVTLARKNIPDYWIWGFWISPIAWAIQALVINELRSDEWVVKVPDTD